MSCRTWDGVVQDETEEASDEHVRREEHDDDLVQLLYSFQRKKERINKLGE